LATGGGGLSCNVGAGGGGDGVSVLLLLGALLAWRRRRGKGTMRHARLPGAGRGRRGDVDQRPG
jgi:MYXO-CTERM domain-containing protein